MNIGIDVSPLQNGHRLRGIGSYTRGLLDGLATLDTGDRYTLYYWKGLPLDIAAITVPRTAVWVGVPFPHIGALSALAAQQLILPALLAHRPDVYHQLGIVPNPKEGSSLPVYLRDRAVITMHDVIPLVYPDVFLRGKRMRTLLYRWMLQATRYAPQVLADSSTTQQDIIRLLGVRAERVSVVPLAVPPGLMAALESPIVKKPPGLPDSYILTVAGDYPNKNLSTLLDAYARIAMDSNIPDLVIVGPPGPSVERYRTCRAAAARLHCYAQLDDAELAATYRGALMVVVPSEYEGFGLPALEAMAAGTPVIAADAASLPELTGDAAILVPVHDSSAFADAIRSLYADPVARGVLSAKGRARARQFTWMQTATGTYAAYCRAAKQRGSGSKRAC